MKEVSLQIKKVKYPVKFGFRASTILADKWKLKHYSKVVERVAKHLGGMKEGVEPTIQQLEAMGEIAWSGIIAATPNAEITSDDVVDWFFDNMEEVPKIFDLWVNSLPDSVKNASDPKNVKGVGK